LDAIQERLAAIRAATEVIFTLETLDYLARGGRIGRVQALAGALLSLKPVIGVDHKDGKYNNLARSRTVSRALDAIADQLYAVYGNTAVWVSIMHGRFAEKAGALGDQLGRRLNVAKMETLRVSPVLGVHTGPAVVGAAVAPMKLFEDLI
jgi:DegV family protein with EDD domain